MMKYEATHLSTSGDKKKEKSFDTEGEAWVYIGTKLCDDCKKYFDSLLASPCAVEWTVNILSESQQIGKEIKYNEVDRHCQTIV